MAREVIVCALGLLTACFHASPYSPQRTNDALRAMQAPGPSSKTQPGSVPTPAAGEPVTAQQAYELAVANNLDIATLVGEAQVAEAEIRAARQLDNPSLRVTNFNLDDNGAAGPPSARIALRVPIPRPGTVRTRTRGAKLAADALQSDTEEAKRELRGTIYRLYASLAMFTADLEHAARLSELHREHRDHVAARVDQAAATKLDLALADVGHAEAREEEATIREEMALVEAELQRLTGVAVPLRFQADPAELRVVDLDTDRELLTKHAMEARPDLRGGHAYIGAAQAELHLARSEAWPWFEWAQVQYRAGPGSNPKSWGFGIALTLPLFSWNRGEIRAAKARVRQREIEQRSRIAAVAIGIDEAVTRVERTAARVHEIETGLLPRLDDAAREADAALATSAVDFLVAHELRLKSVEARRKHLEALLAHREAVIDLETVVGVPIARVPAPREPTQRDTP